MAIMHYRGGHLIQTISVWELVGTIGLKPELGGTQILETVQFFKVSQYK